MIPCKLCLASQTEPVSTGGRRSFVHCLHCGLCFVPTEEWVTLDEERDRYAHHENTRENAGYLHFLNEIVREVEALEPRATTLLDFGCGENAVLTQLLSEKGYSCIGYDPLYRSQKLVGSYDLVIVCEVIEHLRDLRAEVSQWQSLVTSKGKVLVRTRLYPSIEGMADWWYARDKTHINFFCEKALVEAACLAGKNAVKRLTEDMFLWL